MEFERLRVLLRSLSTADPALHGADELLDHTLDFPSLARLKDYEDRLDGLMCAYIAQYLWRWGMRRARVFGTLRDGYITTPVPLGRGSVNVALELRVSRPNTLTTLLSSFRIPCTRSGEQTV